MAFTHLHVHTEYSLLDGSNKIKEYVRRVKELGMDSAAITDHGVMYGVIDFYKAAKAEGIRPIIGCEVYVAPGSRFDRENASGEERYYHLVLLAENDQGYSNLMKIVSRGFVDGYYYRPRVDMETLETYHEGVIALSACLAGEVQRNLLKNQYEEAKTAALRYETCFGKGNFFLELQDHGLPEQKAVNQKLMRLHTDTGIELVATNDVHYTYETDAEAHDILLCLQTGKKLADEDRMRYEGGQYFVKSEEEMRNLFPYAQEAIDNTQKIADRCHVEIEFGVTKLPKFDVPEGYDSWSYLNKLCSEGLERCYGERTGEVRDQLDYELSVIRKMGYVDYFLIVWDFIRYAREHDIMVGPGRGSAAGSVVSYTLGITQLDPIRYQLLFERFLNPERVSMPDIDVDFCYERRQEVIDYVVEKYGKDRVVQIVTFGTLAARGVIRDVGRVMDLPYARCDQIAKMIPNELNITIERALKMNPQLRELYESDAEVRHLITMSRRLEGLPRHTSMHAAGVVISQKAVDEYVPLSRGSDGSITTQFTMTTLEELGLLKMDFLGLRTLTVIQDAAKNVEETEGILPDMDAIDYDDKDVLASIGSGHTEGVFQLESAGMQSFMKELKPQSLEDVIAGISLYRPGPMDFIPNYIRGKNHPETITYDCPQLEPILSPTYGCIVYQEQVMQIVRDLAGYTLGRSDEVRRAMSKKKVKVMEQERQYFVYGNPELGVKGCLENGIDEKTANHIFDEMSDFAKYAFNKSHAAAYAIVSYQTAWLKYYYPVEFMAALMTSFLDNSSKVAEYIQVCRQMGIEVLPPDVNAGRGGFTVDVVNGKKAIRYGLSAIKSVGRPVIETIVAEREQNGPFRSLQDFAERLAGREVNKRVFESFIKAGAFDGLSTNRRQMIQAYPLIVDAAVREKKNAMTGQMSLFDLVSPEEKQQFQVSLPDVSDFSESERLSMEKEVLGIYVSGHPLRADEDLMKQVVTRKTSDFIMEESEGEAPQSAERAVTVHDGERAVIGGLVEGKTIKYTRQNQAMAFVTIEDLVGSVEVIVFPRDFEKYGSLLEEDAKVFVAGRVSVEEGKDAKLICEKIVPFAGGAKEVWIRFADRNAYEDHKEMLKAMLSVSHGKDEVILYLAAERAVRRLGEEYGILAGEMMIEDLRQKFGAKNVEIRNKKITI